MSSHRIACVALAAALAPTTASAETCNLYQYYLRSTQGGSCSSYTAPWQTPPVPTGDEPAPTGSPAPTFYARAVPLCISGLDKESSSPSPCKDPTSEVHSLDGTTGMYHIDPVAGSNTWVIFLVGGGSCGVLPGFSSAADACYNATQASAGIDGYATATGDALNMTSQHASLKTSNVYNRIYGRGPMRPDAGALFASANRIIVYKSTFDRWTGNRTNASALGTKDTINLYFHGNKILQAMLNDLNQSRGPITLDGVTLSKLSGAKSVILIGNSGGAGGVLMIAERFAGWVHAIAPQAMVQFVADSRMLPDLNSEAKFANATNTIWSNITADTTTIRNSVNARSPRHDAIVEWSNGTYLPGGDVANLLDSWGDWTSSTEPFLDPSCLASHPTDVSWCYSEQHVLAHHFNEPLFLHQTLGDSVHGSTPLSFYDTIDADRANGYNPVPADPGFRFDGVPTPWTYMMEKANRVIYVANELLQNRGAAVRDETKNPVRPSPLGVYVAYGDCHITSLSSAWQNHQMVKNGVRVSAEDALGQWLASGGDQAWIQDMGADPFNPPATWTATYPITNSAYRGWRTTWTTCP